MQMEHSEAPAGKRRKIKRNKKSKAARKAKGKEVDNEEEEEVRAHLPVSCGGVSVRCVRCVSCVYYANHDYHCQQEMETEKAAGTSTVTSTAAMEVAAPSELARRTIRRAKRRSDGAKPAAAATSMAIENAA
jgi:hypothetical protein